VARDRIELPTQGFSGQSVVLWCFKIQQIAHPGPAQ
jgi:hypothetical protein